jgi:hypothetical protein
MDDDHHFILNLHFCYHRDQKRKFVNWREARARNAAQDVYMAAHYAECKHGVGRAEKG